VIVDVINTGTELMLGAVLNSHQQWLCRQLADLGYVVDRQVAVADSHTQIEAALRESLSRADLIITTGGLGPTSDDLTRDCVAQLLGLKMHENQEALARIQAFFKSRNRPMPERTRIEAMVPEGATVLPNLQGTAPGLALEIHPNRFRAGGERSWLILLPGPGRELRPMFTNFVIPLLQRALPLKENFTALTLRSTGLGESVVQEKIEEPLHRLVDAGLSVGYCARPGQVDVRISARGPAARQLVDEGAAIVRTALGQNIFGTGDEEMEEIVIHLLTERKRTVALAESCTGGCIAHRLTNISGASAVLRASLVTYSNDAKQQFLGVNRETLDRHGAVSEAVAKEMAEGARRVNQTDYALAVTGIAGPTGGTAEKPVGTVFIALASATGTAVWKMFNPWDRQTFKEVTTRQALNELRLSLLQRQD
jgi:nicotinamide-nucleotide amidase